jgi:putative transposase
VPPDTRDEVLDFVAKWSSKTELPARRFVVWLGIARGKFYQWKQHYGRAHEHNGQVPREYWIEPWERQAIIDYFDSHPLDGYRRLSFMMLDDDVVAVSPSTTFRVLKAAGRLNRFNGRPSKKGTGFVQPGGAHQHWHIDVSYLNLAGTFYYLCSILDGYSRYIVHWEIRESMREVDVETIVQRAREKFPDARPRMVSDNGPQFIARDFKTFIRLSGMTHVRTAPYYPQSNGKIEAWHKTLKVTTIRPHNPETLDEARRLVASFVAYYNDKRLHSATGYIAPTDKLAGRETIIWAERDRKLEAARELRRQRRAQLREVTL